jgi:hypothetical protein
MNRFIRSLAIVSVLLLLGMITAVGQEVTYSAGPSIPITMQGNNGGFAWGDVNGDGVLDLLFRQNNLMINIFIIVYCEPSWRSGCDRYGFRRF